MLIWGKGSRRAGCRGQTMNFVYGKYQGRAKSPGPDRSRCNRNTLARGFLSESEPYDLLPIPYPLALLRRLYSDGSPVSHQRISRPTGCKDPA